VTTQIGTTIVTGAGGGIGSATARLLAGPGVQLALLDRKLNLLDKVATDCRAEGAEVFVAAADQADAEAVEAAVASIVAAQSDIRGLFANAGMGDSLRSSSSPMTNGVATSTSTCRVPSTSVRQ
jgi:short-subunit dehydrogenase